MSLQTNCKSRFIQQTGAGSSRLLFGMRELFILWKGMRTCNQRKLLYSKKRFSSCCPSASSPPAAKRSRRARHIFPFAGNCTASSNQKNTCISSPVLNENSPGTRHSIFPPMRKTGKSFGKYSRGSTGQSIH